MERRAILVASAALLGGCLSGDEDDTETTKDESRVRYEATEVRPADLDSGSNVFLFPSSLRKTVRDAVDAPDRVELLQERPYEVDVEAFGQVSSEYWYPLNDVEGIHLVDTNRHAALEAEIGAFVRWRVVANAVDEQADLAFEELSTAEQEPVEEAIDQGDVVVGPADPHYGLVQELARERDGFDVAYEGETYRIGSGYAATPSAPSEVGYYAFIDAREASGLDEYVRIVDDDRGVDPETVEELLIEGSVTTTTEHVRSLLDEVDYVVSPGCAWSVSSRDE